MGVKVGEKLGEKVGEKNGEKVGESLGEIHKLNLCHRDVKPIKKNLSLVVLESMSYMRKCPYCKKHVNTGNNLYVNNAETMNCNLKHQQQLDLTLEPRFFIPILK